MNGEQVLRSVASTLENLAQALVGIEDSVSAPDFPPSENPGQGLVNFREAIQAMAAEAERFAEDYVFGGEPSARETLAVAQQAHERLGLLIEAPETDDLPSELNAIRALVSTIISDLDGEDLKPYWRDPHSDGWVDAWNGWYRTEAEAAEHVVPAVRNKDPWLLTYGSGLVALDDLGAADKPDSVKLSYPESPVYTGGRGGDEYTASFLAFEREERKEEALRKLLADWFQSALNEISERGGSHDWQDLVDDAKARHETFGIEWDDSFVPDYVREILAMQQED